MNNKDFASALAHKSSAAPDPPAAATRTALPKNKRKHIGGYFPPEVARRLRILASEEETTVQELLTEGLREMFAKRGISIL